MRTLPLLAVSLALLAANRAQAHAILVDSQPAPQGHVAAGPLDLMLRYNSRIDAARSRLALRRPDGTSEVLHSEPNAGPAILRAHVAALTPGDYVVQWQVLATDGHITRGRVPFTVESR